MTSRPAAPEKSLVRVYVWIIALVTLLTVGVALVVALERPVTYTAESRIEVLSVPTRGAPIAPNMGTEREVATSGSVAEDAAARLDSSRSGCCPGTEGLRHRRHVVLVITTARHPPRRRTAGPRRSPTATWRRATPSRRSGRLGDQLSPASPRPVAAPTTCSSWPSVSWSASPSGSARRGCGTGSRTGCAARASSRRPGRRGSCPPSACLRTASP